MSPLTTFFSGFRLGLPVILGIIPFGLVAGVSAASVGLSNFQAIMLSALVFAGASQLAGLQLIASGAPVFVILLTTLFINLRFAMYSASLAPYLARLPVASRSALAYLMTDQAYALSVARFVREPEMPSKEMFYLGFAAPIWVMWMLTTAVGVFVGAQVPGGWSLEFAIPLIFTALVVPAVTDRASAAAALAAGVTVVLAHALPFNLSLIVAALAGIATGVVVETITKTGTEQPS